MSESGREMREDHRFCICSPLPAAPRKHMRQHTRELEHTSTHRRAIPGNQNPDQKTYRCKIQLEWRKWRPRNSCCIKPLASSYRIALTKRRSSTTCSVKRFEHKRTISKAPRETPKGRTEGERRGHGHIYLWTLQGLGRKKDRD